MTTLHNVLLGVLSTLSEVAEWLAVFDFTTKKTIQEATVRLFNQIDRFDLSKVKKDFFSSTHPLIIIATPPLAPQQNANQTKSSLLK